MDNLVILVSTFDKYSICWGPFCYSIQKYWINHPDIYFITNTLIADCGKSILVGADRGWSNNLLFALRQIESPYILYTQEDYWIQKPVDASNIIDYLSLFEKNLVDYIRLAPESGESINFQNDTRLVIYPDNSKWRTSLHMAIWRKSVLMDLIIPGENQWDFEINGSIRSRKYGNRFLRVTNRINGISYTSSAIVEGEWSKAAYDFSRNEGIYINFNGLAKIPFAKRKYRQARRALKEIKKKIIRALHIT